MLTLFTYLKIISFYSGNEVTLDALGRSISLEVLEYRYDSDEQDELSEVKVYNISLV